MAGLHRLLDQDNILFASPPWVCINLIPNAVGHSTSIAGH